LSAKSHDKRGTVEDRANTLHSTHSDRCTSSPVMMQSNGHQQYLSDDGDRKNRFQTSPDREQRATSQPPHSNGQGNLSPSQQYHISPTLSGGGAGISPWVIQRTSSGLNPNSRPGPQSVPTRSSSFSAQTPSQFSSAMQNARAFASTFEDDESLDGFPESYDERYLPPSQQFRGRQYAQDTRSRSQSLAAPARPGPIGSPLQSSIGWPEVGSLSSNPLNIPASRYGPPGDGRHGLGASGRSTSNNLVPASANGFSTGGVNDISNMSPFRRNVDQILLDDGNAFRELWAGMNPPRDENGGGGSGTTSRRHSVSVVQPRGRGTVVGFNAPGNDGDEPAKSTSVFQSQSFGRGGLMLSDDDLASDLGMLSINTRDGPGPVSSSAHPPSQPTSLPIYAPLSRSPPVSDHLSPYQSVHISVPGSRQQPIGSPSDSGLSGGSPTRSNHSQFDSQTPETSYLSQYQQQQQQQLTARFIPGQGIQYLPSSHSNGVSISRANANPSYGGSVALASSPLSPTTPRIINPQQPPQYPQQMQRRPSDASAPLNELGKGVPLHSVPASWPLYIVEFKAGRTDLFYLTDLSLDIRVGDLVIVEADRGKDLGKVVNDSITLKEVEEFQKEQLARVGFGDGQPTSPGGTGGGQAQGAAAKKEINPKMIYGKAQGQDTQCVLRSFLSLTFD
jgi:hypothetical protein